MTKEKAKDTKKEDVVKVPAATYQTVGSLGVQSQGHIYWETCRDRFQNASEGHNAFFFRHQANTQDNVINFIRTFESACDCPYDQEVVFKKTTDKNVLCIEMSDWWKYKVRRSLLTALLRCGQAFNKDNGEGFVKALNSQVYTSHTKKALERFLSGYTAVKIMRNSFSGWQNFFSNRTEQQIDACLVKLKKKKPQEVSALVG